MPFRLESTLKSLSIIILCLLLSTRINAFSVESQIQELLQCYTQHDRPSRSLLQRRHVKEFPDDTPFQSFARIVCQANIVPRKELFEVWSTALFIQDQFPDSRRIADLCCGHSLLSFALLFLDEQDTTITHQPRSAVCIDKRMPLSAEKVAQVMWNHFPEWESRWDFVEGSLDCITPSQASGSSHPLLCGIHACGPLSDQILSLALHRNAPVVLVPCCHTKKSLEESDREFYDSQTSYTLSEFVDRCRMERLTKAGYKVEQHSIPELFTGKHQLILAKPGRLVHPPRPPLSFSTNLPKLLTITIDDTREARAMVRSMAGRRAAEDRKQPPPPSFCVSLAMPQSDSVTTSTLTKAAEEFFGKNNHDNLQVVVEYADAEPFWHEPSGKYYRTFRMTYSHHHRRKDSLQKQYAKEIHESLCQEITEAFPGSRVRS